jgi:hypothetical protein
VRVDCGDRRHALGLSCPCRCGTGAGLEDGGATQGGPTQGGAVVMIRVESDRVADLIWLK